MERLLNLEVTSACYADCSMCPREKVKNKGFISLDLVDKLIDKAKGYDLYEISISGRGEPTLHPELVEIVKKFKQLNTTISVVTTTAGLNENNYKDIIDEIDILRISVSSLEEELFKKVHRGLDYKKTWDTIEKVISYNPEKIYIHLVGGQDTYPGLESTVKFFKEHGVNNIYLFPLWNRGGNLEEQEILEIRKKLVKKYNIFYSEDEYLDDEKIKYLDEPNYCFVSDKSISVNCFGDMIGCFQDFENLTKVCRVDDNIDFIKERRKMLGKMNVCRECNLLRQVRR